MSLFIHFTSAPVSKYFVLHWCPGFQTYWEICFGVPCTATTLFAWIVCPSSLKLGLVLVHKPGVLRVHPGFEFADSLTSWVSWISRQYQSVPSCHSPCKSYQLHCISSLFGGTVFHICCRFFPLNVFETCHVGDLIFEVFVVGLKNFQ